MTETKTKPKPKKKTKRAGVDAPKGAQTSPNGRTVETSQAPRGCHVLHRCGRKSAGRGGHADDLPRDDRPDGEQGILDQPERQDARGDALLEHPSGDREEGKEARFKKADPGKFVCSGS